MKSKAMVNGALRSVLYVDDDPSIRELVQLVLEGTSELRVRTADGCDAALAKMREQLPDLVLLDVMMPGMDGPATLKRMREAADLASVPVVFMTAKSMPGELERLRRTGAVGIIAKPFDPMRLAEEIRRLWEQMA